MKEELHQTRGELQQSKEKLVEKDDCFRKKLLESDAEIEASKRTIAEPEVSCCSLDWKDDGCSGSKRMRGKWRRVVFH